MLLTVPLEMSVTSAPCRATRGSALISQEVERHEGKGKATSFIGVSVGSKAEQSKQLRIG